MDSTRTVASQSPLMVQSTHNSDDRLLLAILKEARNAWAYHRLNSPTRPGNTQPS